MLIHNVELVNFCQHERFVMELSPGLNLLAGPNGSGKTNLLRAIQLLLVGDAGGDRNKLDDVRQGIGTGQPSYVEGLLSHSGANMVVRRSLASSVNSLTVDDGQPIHGIGEINTELCRRLGATKKQIQDYVFVRQRKIDEMFDQRPADRAASLAALFGVDKAERVWKSVGEFVGNVEVPTSLVDVDAIRRQLTEDGAKVVSIDAQVAALAMPGDLQTAFNGYGEIVRNYQACSEAIEELDRLQQLVEAKQAAYAGFPPTQERQQADLRMLDAALSDIEAKVVAATGQLQQWFTYDAAETARLQYADAAAAFAQKWRAGPPLPPPVCDEMSPEDAEKRATLHRFVAHHMETVRQLAGEDAVCPTCGQDMPARAEKALRLEGLRRDLVQAKADLAPLDVADADRQTYLIAHGVFETQSRQYTEGARQLGAQKEQLCSFACPETSREELQGVVAEKASYTAAVADLQKTAAETSKQAAAVEGTLDGLLAAVSRQRTKTAALPACTQQDSEQATRDLADLRQRHTRLLRLQGELAVAKAAVAHAETQLADVQEVQERGQRTREVVTHLEGVRAVFHRNEAPKMVSYTYIETMLDEVNNTLELFEAPFRVEMDESLGFLARFLDGVRVQPDQRLSIGERIVLAMAFRVTVNSTFASQVGVLILDEPTAGLDEHNLGCLPRALERLRDLSHQRGLQVLFVTHEPRIGHLFDRSIELEVA